MIDCALIWESLPKLIHGAFVSLQITLVAAGIGLILGTLLGLAESTKQFMLSCIIGVYVTVIRGTPMLVQILFMYYVLPQFGIKIDPFWAASMAIGLNSSAYISQIIRSGVKSVPKGQIEAAYTLGFTSIKTLRYIVFPQAIRVALPALGNELTTLIKDSSLASIIGVMELAKEASSIRSRTYDAFSILLAISIMYFVMTATISMCMKKVERRYDAHV